MGEHRSTAFTLLLAFSAFVLFDSVRCWRRSAIQRVGVCPPVDPHSAGICVELCSKDKDCNRNQKCCSNGCGHVCMTPYLNKPGWCPSSLPNSAPCSSCSHDYDCPQKDKCCGQKGERVCVPPIMEKPGFCPSSLPIPAPCSPCSHDSDCPQKDKCCGPKGERVCVPPIMETFECPEPTGYGICVELCSSDGDCEPNQKCCSNGCGHVCM